MGAAQAQDFAAGDTVPLVERDIHIPAHPAPRDNGVPFRFAGGSRAEVLPIDANQSSEEIEDMADVTDLPVALRPQIMMLFQSQNYCFATTTGARTPTFYFAQGGINSVNIATQCGRLRTQHRGGPLVDITNARKQHLFFNTRAARNAAYALMPGLPNNAPALAAFIANYRQVPRDNDYHLEFTMVPRAGRPYSRVHRSGGTIVTRPRVPTNAKCLAIVNYVLSRRGQVSVDSVPRHNMPRLTAAQIPAFNVAAFLALV